MWGYLATMGLREVSSPSRLEFQIGGTKDEVGKSNFSEAKEEDCLMIIYFKNKGWFVVE